MCREKRGTSQPASQKWAICEPDTEKVGKQVGQYIDEAKGPARAPRLIEIGLFKFLNKAS